MSGGDLIEGQTSSLLDAFPELPGNVISLLQKARESKMHVIHIRERDSKKNSLWLPWWEKLHPPEGETACGFGMQVAPEPWAAEIPGEPVFEKHTFDAFQSGEVSLSLQKYLKENNITRLYFAGVLTKACVMFTANSAFNLGYEVFVVSDCCGDRSREDHNTAINLYSGYHIHKVSLDELNFNGEV